MSDGANPNTTTPGQSRATSDDVSMNGFNADHVVNEDGEEEESSSDSGVANEELLYHPTIRGSLLNRKGLQPTGVCYDDRMKLHMNVDWSPHDHHPEDPRRIEEIFNTFKEGGLVYTGPHKALPKILRDAPNKYMYRIAARNATKEEICTAHHPHHYDWVESLASMSYQELRILTKIKDQGRDSLYVGSMSFAAALLSAGGAIETCRHVVEGTLKNAFAVIRPPGHHAEYDHAMGFCFFNNVPVAVRVCQRQYPETCRKVLILDWDVHHGNGVQNIFYQDPNVLYISIHVYQNGEFYPGEPENPDIPDGGLGNCGSGLGLGRNINIGWHDQGMGDGEYMAAFQRIVMPIAKEFDPDLVVVSAGFDAAKGDELGGCFVTPPCYAHMTHMLMSLAEGKVAVCLEGGYNLKAISQSALAVARTLMGEAPPRMEIPKINKEAARVLAKVQAYQAPYWECMRQGVLSAPDVANLHATRLHDVIRDSQLQRLQRKHKMMPLHIHREALFKTFENQVLVTPSIHNARRLLVIIHDPPQLVGQLDVDNSFDPHNSFVVDEVLQFIDWAVQHKFGVMDINIPAGPEPEESDIVPFMPSLAEKALEARIQELVCYLWDNYLQLYSDETEIFLIGVGYAHIGIRSLLTCRDSMGKITGIVNFVNGNLRAVKSDIYHDLTSWYKDHSLVYVDNDHACWVDPELRRRVTKRRFGNVIHSSASGLSKMMHSHAGEVQGWILDRVREEDGDTTEDEKME